ncbi:MAG: tetratricopeptide repeat protein [Calditrichaceae bacterium]|nr:tetratricopeptide repeat protein [Calditrichaceae bacterium]MBN2710771.1 tetratricopeptide repeat protein [Calditrichaceae bacterium]RQV94693.1 MAG: tetratricopeptide repeat protein [Calditrichota bacterium]
MADIGYNDNVQVANRKFHIQTASNIGKGLARCEVFEAGQVISTHEIEFERRRISRNELMEQRVRDIVSDLHKDTIQEIEIMFQISQKIKKLKHAPSNVKLGMIFLHNNLIKDSIEQFEMAIQIDPKSTDAINGLAIANIKLNNNKKAIQLLSKALDLGSKFADIYHNLGLAYLNEKQYALALKNLQQALRINPNYLQAHYNLAIMYMESVLIDRGDETLPPPSIRLERAQQQLNKLKQAEIKAFTSIAGKVEKAVENQEIEKAAKILVESRDNIFPVEILSLIGMDFYLKFMYGGKGLNREITQKFEKRLLEAVEENPDYADLWNNLGIVHLIQCRNLFLQALTEFDKALEINPSFEKALKNKKLVENDGKEFLILLRAILK